MQSHGTLRQKHIAQILQRFIQWGEVYKRRLTVYFGVCRLRKDQKKVIIFVKAFFESFIHHLSYLLSFIIITIDYQDFFIYLKIYQQINHENLINQPIQTKIITYHLNLRKNLLSYFFIIKFLPLFDNYSIKKWCHFCGYLKSR